MKTPAEWLKCRDWMGGEYDTPARIGALISEVQADAIASPEPTVTLPKSQYDELICRLNLLLQKENQNRPLNPPINPDAPINPRHFAEPQKA